MSRPRPPRETDAPKAAAGASASGVETAGPVSSSVASPGTTGTSGSGGMPSGRASRGTSASGVGQSERASVEASTPPAAPPGVAAPAPPEDDLHAALLAVRDTCLLRAARRTANRLTRLYAARLAGTGLAAPQFGMLCVIGAGGGGSAAEIARHAGVERSTASRNLDRLEAAGLIAPGPGPRPAYALTEAGRVSLRAALAPWRAVQRDLAAALPHEADAAARMQLRLLDDAARAVEAQDAETLQMHSSKRPEPKADPA